MEQVLIGVLVEIVVLVLSMFFYRLWTVNA